MGRDGPLGSFEEMVVVAALRLADDEGACGASIRRDLTTRLGREVNIGAVHSTLTRLTRKGLVAPLATGPASPRSRPGRPPVFYAVRPEGRRALAETVALRDAVWGGMELPDR